MMPTEAINLWCIQARALLGLGPDGSKPAASEPPSVSNVWEAPLKQTRQQLARLQDAFRKCGYPLGERIANEGFESFLFRLEGDLPQALAAYEAADANARQQALTRLNNSLSRLSAFLSSDAALPVLERNPFAVPLTLRSKLESALALTAGLQLG